MQVSVIDETRPKSPDKRRPAMGLNPNTSSARTAAMISQLRSSAIPLGWPGFRPPWRFVFGLAAVYFGAAKLGLTMAFVAEQVTVVWPPSGISLAAVLVFGHRVWPGIALGAFLANATTGAPMAAALGIAVGNTLEALSGAWMLRRILDFTRHSTG